MTTWVLSPTGFVILVWGSVLLVAALFLYILYTVLVHPEEPPANEPPEPPRP